MRNKTRIKITYIKDMGRNHDQWCDTCLFLRTARKVGDEEVINNFVLGKLRNMSSYISFEIVK